jgi:hypothetical protein
MATPSKLPWPQTVVPAMPGPTQVIARGGKTRTGGNAVRAFDVDGDNVLRDCTFPYACLQPRPPQCKSCGLIRPRHVSIGCSAQLGRVAYLSGNMGRSACAKDDPVAFRVSLQVARRRNDHNHMYEATNNASRDSRFVRFVFLRGLMAPMLALAASEVTGSAAVTPNTNIFLWDSARNY